MDRTKEETLDGAYQAILNKVEIMRIQARGCYIDTNGPLNGFIKFNNLVDEANLIEHAAKMKYQPEVKGWTEADLKKS